MNQPVDILCRARELYASAPSHAAPGKYPEPGTRCVIYALEYAALGAARPGSPALAAIVDAAGTGDIEYWNAEHSTEEVLAAFDRAIAAQRLIAPRLIAPPLQHDEQRDPVHAGQES